MKTLSDDIAGLPSVPATRLKNAFADVWDLVSKRGAVAITRHEKPKGILISVERYQELVNAGRPSLEALTAEYDGLVAKLQTEESRRGLAAAFRASPEELGAAAVEAAARR